MGLDMYLDKTKKIKGMTFPEICATYNWIDAKDNDWECEESNMIRKDKESEVRALVHKVGSEGFQYDNICDEIAYWRKANQIHKWFVDNVQNGEDDCRSHVVYKEQLTELLETAKEVLRSKDTSVAERLLPTQSGFFFGGTDYDQWYYEDIKYTVEQLEKVLNETDFDNYYISYCASW